MTASEINQQKRMNLDGAVGSRRGLRSFFGRDGGSGRMQLRDGQNPACQLARVPGGGSVAAAIGDCLGCGRKGVVEEMQAAQETELRRTNVLVSCVLPAN
jgi:hypothetical protein